MMLCLALAEGEYMTIGENVVIQINQVAGGHCKMIVHAPREITVLRGEVLERGGGQRPACVFTSRRERKEQSVSSGSLPVEI